MPFDAFVGAELAMALAIVGLVALIAHPLARRLLMPAVVGELLVGCAFGPSLLGALPGHIPTLLFPAAVRPGLSAIGQLAIVLYVFLLGWEIDVATLRRQRRLVGRLVTSTVLVPLGLGSVLALWLYQSDASTTHTRAPELAFAMFFGTAMAVTALPVLARVLVDNGLDTSALGTLALATAAAGDVIAWCIVAVVTCIVASSGVVGGLRMALLVSTCVLVVIGIVRPLLHHLSKDRGGCAGLLQAVVFGALVVTAAEVSAAIGLDAIIGALAFGLAMPRNLDAAVRRSVGAPLRRVCTVLLPVFFVSTGLSVDVTSLGRHGLVQLCVVIAVASASKIGGALWAARSFGWEWRKAFVLGSVMNMRGLTELVMLRVGKNLGILNEHLYVIMVCMALVTTASAGVVVQRAGRQETGAAATSGPEESGRFRQGRSIAAQRRRAA